MIVRILIAMLIFSAVVLFHEFGHFLLAKMNHITVEEFALGFGPKIFSFKKNGTVYALKWIPFGGSCSMLGENGDEGENETVPGSFLSASVWGRISVVIAGPLFNLLLAFLGSVIVLTYAGSSPALVTEVLEGSPEAEAGLLEGDIITKFENHRVYLGNELYTYTSLHGVPLEAVHLTVKRGNETLRLEYAPVTTTRYMMGFNYENVNDGVEITYVQPGLPMADSGIQAGDKILALDGTDVSDYDTFVSYLKENPFGDTEVEVTYLHNNSVKKVSITPQNNTYASLCFAYQLRDDLSPLGILKYSVLEVRYWIWTVIDSLSLLARGTFSINDLSGPVGVVDAIGTVYEDTKSEGILVTAMTLLNMLVMLSANLGVMNLLPLPALDGGRLFFLMIEAVFQKPVKRDVEAMIHFAGMALLLLLMVYIMFQDVLKLF